MQVRSLPFPGSLNRCRLWLNMWRSLHQSGKHETTGVKRLNPLQSSVTPWTCHWAITECLPFDLGRTFKTWIAKLAQLIQIPMNQLVTAIQQLIQLIPNISECLPWCSSSTTPAKAGCWNTQLNNAGANHHVSSYLYAYKSLWHTMTIYYRKCCSCDWKAQSGEQRIYPNSARNCLDCSQINGFFHEHQRKPVSHSHSESRLTASPKSSDSFFNFHGTKHAIYQGTKHW